MATVEHKQAELDAAIRRERESFEERLLAYQNVKRVFIRHGHHARFQASLRVADAADKTWRAARDEVARLRQKVRLQEQALCNGVPVSAVTALHAGAKVVG